MANVVIDIATEFTGKKAFKQAETSVDKLNKNVKTLGKSLLAVYSAQKILSYAKSSVKAFAEDDKAAKALGITLKNLGLAYGANVGTVNGFISRLEMQTGVLDDQLRPAMDGLLRATGSVTKAQELLALSLDIAAGTGKSVVQVSTALQRAYLGQTTGLSRLGAGLTKAELSTSSFEEIQTRLATLFAGQASAAADTYAGSLNKLTVAGENAKETIGKGLVDAFVTASNSSSIDDLIGKIDSAAEAMAGFLRETGEFIKITKSIFKFELFATDPNAFKGMGNVSMTKSSQDTQRADAVAKKNAAALTKVTKEQTKVQKDQLKLSKARAIFDLQKIQIEAALKGKLSEEDRARLLLMKAIENENISDIEKYTKLLSEAQKKAKELQATLDAIKANKVGDPFTEMRSGIGKTIAELNEMNRVLGLTTTIQPNLREYTPPVLGGGGAFDKDFPIGTSPTPPTSNAPIGSVPDASAPSRNRGGGVGGVMPVSVNVSIGGSVISESNLIDAITNAIYQQQKNGKAITYNGTLI
jgi:hypothetical protein